MNFKQHSLAKSKKKKKKISLNVTYLLSPTTKVSGKLRNKQSKIFLIQSKISNLIETDNLCDDDKKTAKTFHEYFVNTVQKSGIVIEKSNIKPTELHFDQLNMAIVKPVYNDHLGDEVSLVVIDRWPL